MEFLSYLITGISLGSIYAIIALGYTMVYGIAKMLNFAHGDVIMVGAYSGIVAVAQLGLSPWVTVIVSIVVCAVLGVVIEFCAYKPLRQAAPLSVLITAIGVSYLLQQVAQLAWTSNPKSFTSVVSGLKPISLFGGQLTISAETVVTIIACIVIMVVLIWFVNNTPAGHAMLAVSEDRGAAQLMGVNVNATISLTFAIGSALAEQAAEAAEAELRQWAARQGKYLTGRYSPGYGDWPLAVQPLLAAALDTARRAGLCVTENNLMTPRKSITAILGVSDHPVRGHLAGCGHCVLRTRCEYRKRGITCASE